VSQTVTFAGTGSELAIKTADFGGSIAGLTSTDKIDLSSIDYGLGTSAVYVANDDASTGGTLTITDAEGNHISLTLTGADYSNAVFAGSDDGTGHTLITVNAADDAPKFTTESAVLTANFSEPANPPPDPSPDATGSIAFTDVDLTDRPTAKITYQDVTWLDSDHSTQLTLTPDEISAFENALSLQQTGKNNGTVGWSYSIADSALEFLGKGQTATVVSTITLDDHHGGTDTTQVTVTINGTNDVPVISYSLPNYLAFDGATAVSGAVSTQNTGNGSDGVSLQGWVDWNGKGNAGDSQLLFYNGSTSDAGFGVNGVVTADGKLDLQIQNGGIAGIDTNVTIDANHAHNIALTHVNGVFDLYVDGALAYTTTADVNGIPSGHADFTEIGGVPTEDGKGYATEGFQGSISDVSVWNTALTQAQVQANQTATLTGSESNLVGLFPLHDGSGATVANLATGGGNLTVHGNAAWIDAVSGGVSASLAETKAGLATHGTLTVSDADATDQVTVALDHVSVYLNGTLQADGVHGLSNADLLNYLTVQSGDILNGTANHADFTWNFNSGSQDFDFLAAGETLSLQYTILPTDGHTTGTGEVVTINIAGTNDSPTLDNATLASVAGNDSNPAGSTVSDLFAGKFHDVDDGASFKAIAVTSDSAASAEGVWQYEVAGTNHWVDVGSVSDTQALVLGTDALIRFVPADGFTGTPDPLGVHALDNTYTGAITTSTSTAAIDITAMSTDGTAPVSAQAATISTGVTAPAGAPVFDLDNISVTQNSDEHVFVHGLSVVDVDAAANETYTLAENTAVSGSDATPYSGSGSLSSINSALQTVTYNEGTAEPSSDMITLSVTDNSGASDTLNLIFNLAESSANHVILTGTTGKDVFFGTSYQDQFVFAANAHDMIVNFTPGQDLIDLSAVVTTGNVATWMSQHVATSATNPADTLITIDAADTILLKGVTATSLHASDFIVHS